MRRLLIALLLCPVVALAQGIPTKSGSSTDLMDVNSKKAALFSPGKSAIATYSISFSTLTAATAHTVSVEAPAGNTLRLIRWCIGTSNATAASSIAVLLQRRTTASSGGTPCANEGTGASNCTKLDPGDGNFPGVARLDGTPGTAGAVLDQYNLQIGIIATGAGGSFPICQDYGNNGDKTIVVSPGITNGISLTVPAMGAGSLAGSISMIVVVE